MRGTRGYLSEIKKNKKGNKNSECEKHYGCEMNVTNVSIFKFPDHDKEPQKRAIWIARVPCKDCHPDKNANLYISLQRYLSRRTYTYEHKRN